MTKFYAMIHEPSITGELFIAKCRQLFSHLTAAAQVSEHFQIDMIYAKFHVTLRGRVARSEITTFNDLITRCRQIESLWRESGLMPTNYSANSSQQKITGSSNSATGSSTVPSFRCLQHKTNHHLWDRCRMNPSSPNYPPSSGQQVQPNRVNQQTVSKQLVTPAPPTTHNNNVGNHNNVLANAQPLSLLSNSKRPVCFRCNVVGHISSNCPNGRSTNESKTDNVETAAINFDLLFSRDRIHAKAIVNGFVTHPLMDGNSSHSVLSTEDYHRIKDNCPSEERGCVVTLGNGLRTPSSSLIFLVPVTLGEGLAARSFDFPFIYTPETPFDLTIIGLDLIAYADIDIDYARRNWCFRDCPEVKFPSYINV